MNPMKDSFFDNFNKIYIGYDDIFKTLNDVAKYPPHDIIKLSENEFVVNLALAGFTKESISIIEKDNKLIVSGKPDDIIGIEHKTEEGTHITTGTYIHSGISKRAFKKEFNISEGSKIEQATFKDGILSIKVVKTKPNIKEKVIQIQ